MPLPKTVRILQNIGHDGRIRKGDLFTLSGGMYQSNRVESVHFTDEYIKMHLEGIRFDYVSKDGRTMNHRPFGWPEMFRAV